MTQATPPIARFRSLASLVLVLQAAGFTANVLADDAASGVRDYGRPGDDPATRGVDESVLVANDALIANNRYRQSISYRLTADDTNVSVYRYQKGAVGSGFYQFDVARFSSASKRPKIEITLRDTTEIESVEIHPEPLYSPGDRSISGNGKSLAFTMSDALPYCIVAINGSATGERSGTVPLLAIVNDPPESNKPPTNAGNVLNFKEFARAHLEANPIADRVGEVCRAAGTVTDTSRNTADAYTWEHGAGRFVRQTEKNVRFPDKRVRSPRDVSDAFRAALARVRSSATLDTIYFPAGTYVWSGLSIKDWDGNGADGKLTIYLDEDALLVNRIQECREAMEPAIGIWDSSGITVSGRGVIDGNGCYNVELDGKDARETPHQGGAMIVRSQDIVFNDTYLRDAKQWNWECHTVENLALNNVKGLSPYAHAWVDGLDLTSGQNVTVNGAFTLGNDDTFASGHYNPSDEFPRRFLDELERAQGEARVSMEARKASVCAAAAIYNRDRLRWDTEDSENIVLRGVLGWSGLANSVRLGHNTRWNGPADARESYRLKSYRFENFHSALRRGGDAIRVQNGSFGSYPQYESLVFRNCSFAGNTGDNVAIPAGNQLANFRPGRVVIKDCWFKNANRAFLLRGIEELTINDLCAGGDLLTRGGRTPLTIQGIGNLTFTASGRPVSGAEP